MGLNLIYVKLFVADDTYGSRCERKLLKNKHTCPMSLTHLASEFLPLLSVMLKEMHPG